MDSFIHSMEEASSLLRSTVERDLLTEICHPERSSNSRRRTPTPSSSENDLQAPKCRPWSEADFFRRLRTFTPRTWFGKSLTVSPPRCAAHGWTNVGVDALACELCHSVLMIDTDDEPAPDVLSSSHAATCAWQNQACAPEVSQFPLVTTECLVEHTAHRLAGCRRLVAAYKEQMAINVPEELAEALAGIQVQDAEPRDSPPHSLTLGALVRRLEECQQQDSGSAAAGAAAGTNEDEKEKKDALVLALYGWEASQQQQQQQQQQQPSTSTSSSPAKSSKGWVLSCGLCGRRVEVGRVVDRRSSLGSGRVMEGQGRAKARRVGGASDQEAPPPAAPFDVVSQHRVFCVWVERGLEDKGQPGWRQTLKALVSRMRRVVSVKGLLLQDASSLPLSSSSGGGGPGAAAAASPEGMYQHAKNLLDTM